MAAEHHVCIESPIGPLSICSDDTAITTIEFGSALSERLAAGDSRDSGPGPASVPVLAAAVAQLGEYFLGSRQTFELPLAPRGTEFQQAVWEQLRIIPFGETRTYGALARAIGRPQASRAVGAANGSNPLPIVLPCHRVVGSNGSLTGFGGGLPIKRWLLIHEGQKLVDDRLLAAESDGFLFGTC
jgi:methylated-DNA-[protein]-cysteine S-methyltransferase